MDPGATWASGGPAAGSQNRSVLKLNESINKQTDEALLKITRT